MTDTPLDEKLDELSIWIESNRYVQPQTWEEEIWPLIKEKFKQAFREAGWKPPEEPDTGDDEWPEREATE